MVERKNNFNENLPRKKRRTKKEKYNLEKQKEKQVAKERLEKIKKETEFIAMEDKLMENPETMDKMDEINKKYEHLFEKEVKNTKNKLSSILNMMEDKLNIINWVSTKNIDLVSKDWKIKWLTQKVSLENLIFKGQKLAILNPKTWKKVNVVWWKDITWDPTYVVEWTKNRVYIENWLQITNYEEKIPKFENSKTWKKSVNKVIHSSPSEKSIHWTTLCSRTAHKNLKKFGINSPIWHAINVMRIYWKSKILSFPFGDGKIIDLFVKTKSEYWHRAAAFFNNWKCYVLDPYYPVVNWKRTTAPIPYEVYSKGLQSMWRRVIWWVPLA